MEGALITLAVLACPVGMGLMMWFMGKNMKQGGNDNAAPAQPKSVEQLREEQTRLEAEIAVRERERHLAESGR